MVSTVQITLNAATSVLLAVFTIVLAMATVVLVIKTSRLAKWTEKMATATQKDVDITTRIFASQHAPSWVEHPQSPASWHLEHTQGHIHAVGSQATVYLSFINDGAAQAYVPKIDPLDGIASNPRSPDLRIDSSVSTGLQADIDKYVAQDHGARLKISDQFNAAIGGGPLYDSIRLAESTGRGTPFLVRFVYTDSERSAWWSLVLQCLPLVGSRIELIDRWTTGPFDTQRDAVTHDWNARTS